MDPSGEEEFPEPGELVIATVEEVRDYGAYLSLDEYGGLRSFLHISEVSTSWVRNIRDYVRPGQKVVAKVLRVDPQRMHVDLSLRRVSGKERQEKLMEWKKRKRAETLLENIGAKLGVEDPKAFALEYVAKLEEKFPSAYAALEEFAEKGEQVGEKLKFPPEVSKAIAEIAKQKIKLPTVKIKGVFHLTCPGPRGIEAIKDSLLNCKASKRLKGVKLEMYTAGAPKYMVEITAKNWKEAEKALKELVDCVLKRITRHGGEGSFERKE
ncbi:translation initiation factor IF-2 subunit alpha [Candidatus Bathyarchaeota archaeon]|nr:MAG: translation initiation factor IF-2 subunit alpha [Candidatus Hecatellales archaeon]RLI33865.1 MAG: translation initiation factor IF-2 subunit alpha [Candidatus Bathyarchaeota archaeon]